MYRFLNPGSPDMARTQFWRHRCTHARCVLGVHGYREGQRSPYRYIDIYTHICVYIYEYIETSIYLYL